LVPPGGAITPGVRRRANEQQRTRISAVLAHVAQARLRDGARPHLLGLERERFSAQRMTSAYLALYERLINASIVAPTALVTATAGGLAA